MIMGVRVVYGWIRAECTGKVCRWLEDSGRQKRQLNGWLIGQPTLISRNSCMP